MTPPGIGRRIRASGEIGTWYDSVQLEAEAEPRVLGRGHAAPVILRRPPDASDEWRLVSVTVRIEDVQRSGDTWRAEATMGAGGDLPIVGLAGSGVGADLLEAGRSARIVGIVKRAHPSASDQRFAVAPRATRDIRLGRLSAGQDAANDASGGGSWDDDGPGSPGHPDGAVGGDTASTSLATLDTFGDAIVRTGGRVTSMVERTMRLDDGTGQAFARLDPEVVVDPPIRVGEVVNVTGRVRLRDGVRPELAVRSSGDLLRASSLTATVAGPGGTSDGDEDDAAFLAGTIDDAPGHGGGGATAAASEPDLRVLLIALLGSLSVVLLAAAALILAWPRIVVHVRARRHGVGGTTGAPSTPAEVRTGLP